MSDSEAGSSGPTPETGNGVDPVRACHDHHKHETLFLQEIDCTTTVTVNMEASLRVTLCVTSSPFEIRGGRVTVVVDRSRAPVLAERAVGKKDA